MCVVCLADYKKEVSETLKPEASVSAIRGIVRIAGKDMKGQQQLVDALTKIRGIGYNISRSIVKAIERDLGIARTAKVGALTEAQITAIEDLLKNLSKHGIASFLVNHARDDDTGENKHFIQSDLQFTVRQDVEKEKTLRTWIGWRTSLGQKTRGQHNRTTGRSGITVGVLKKAVKDQKAAAAKTAQATPAPTAAKK